MGRGIPIHVLGTSLTIQTDESPEYVQELVDYISKKIAGLEKSVSTKDSLRLAVLALILVADELFKERRNPSGGTGDDRLGDIADDIISKLDAALD
jgi:cell division protein ZapA